MSEQVGPGVGDLYPHLSAEEQLEAKENLDRYLGVVLSPHFQFDSDLSTFRRP